MPQYLTLRARRTPVFFHPQLDWSWMSLLKTLLQSPAFLWHKEGDGKLHNLYPFLPREVRDEADLLFLWSLCCEHLPFLGRLVLLLIFYSQRSGYKMFCWQSGSTACFLSLLGHRSAPFGFVISPQWCNAQELNSPSSEEGNHWALKVTWMV